MRYYFIGFYGWDSKGFLVTFLESQIGFSESLNLCEKNQIFVSVLFCTQRNRLFASLWMPTFSLSILKVCQVQIFTQKVSLQVTPSPADSISSLSFSPRADILVATSWDNQVYSSFSLIFVFFQSLKILLVCLRFVSQFVMFEFASSVLLQVRCWEISRSGTSLATAPKASISHDPPVICCGFLTFFLPFFFLLWIWWFSCDEGLMFCLERRWNHCL